MNQVAPDQVAPIVPSAGELAARAQRWLARAAIDVRASTWVQVAALTALYFATAKLGIDLKVAHGVVTPVWAPTGISLVALVVFGNRLWPGVALGAFLANVSSHVSVPTALGIATGNTFEALFGAYLLLRVADFRSSLGRVQDVLALIVLGAVVSTTVAATIGTSTLWLSGEIHLDAYRETWLLWWFGDGVGVMIVAPLLFSLLARDVPPIRRSMRFEALTLAFVLALGSRVLFSGDRWHYPYVLLPFLVWAALRFGTRGAAIANFIVTSLAIWGTVNGSVVIPSVTPTQTVQLIQALTVAVGVSMLIVAAVIREREVAEGELAQSLSLLQAALDSTADGIVVVDGHGRIVRFNQRFVEMWSLPSEVVAAGDDDLALGFVVDQLSKPERFLSRVRDVYADAEAESHDVLEFKDGRVFERYSRPQRIEGSTVGRVWSFRDVTEARQAEEIKARFMDMATHELRAPIQLVQGYSELTLEHWDALDDEKRRQSVLRVKQAAERLKRLADDLLVTSRIEAGRLDLRIEAVEVGEALGDAVHDAAGVVVQTDLAQPALMLADAAYLQQMLGNYLSNAAKYGSPPVIVEAGTSDGFVEVRVRDAGPGVPPELVPTLFERFTPARSAMNPDAPGTGLGLSIVRELARAQGGDAWYESCADGSGCFCFRLPVADW